MKKTHLIYIIPLTIIILLFLTRLTLPRQIDDLHPNIPCEQEYIDKSDILWVIPKFREIPIDENQTWCKEILSLNKTLGLHGFTHTYEEFKHTNLTQENITEAIQIFENCFGFKPTMFKPPQTRINLQNELLIKQSNLILKTWFNQAIHKVYHCDNDTTTNDFGGYFTNDLHDWL